LRCTIRCWKPRRGSFDNGQRVLFLADTPNEIHHALDLAAEFGWNLVILGGTRGVARGGPVEGRRTRPSSQRWTGTRSRKLAPKAQKKDDEDAEPDLLTTESWSAEWEDDFFEPLALRRERIRLWEEEVNNIAALMAAGVPVGVTSRELKGPGDILAKLRDALELEMTPEQALAALTTEPAKILGIDNALGTVDEGNAASLTVLTKPLEEKEAKVRYVFVGGERFTFEARGGKTKDDDGEEEGEESEGSEEEDTPEDKHPWRIETEADRNPSRLGGGSLLLTNATVITVTGGTLENADVLIQNGKIRSVGQDLRAPGGVDGNRSDRVLGDAGHHRSAFAHGDQRRN
jgi:hypothetical protein